MIRFVLLSQTLALLAFGVLWLDNQSHPPVRHTTVPTNSEAVHASGRVEGASPDVELRFEIVGRIEQLLVREGDTVHPGQELVHLHSATAQHQVDLAQAELNLAAAKLLRLRNGAHEQERLESSAALDSRQVRLNRAQLTLQRTLRLDGTSVVSKQEIDNSRADVDSLKYEVAAAQARLDLLNAPPRSDELQAAEAQVEAAQAKLGLAHAELDKTVLVAPCHGQVAKRNCETGELTGPNVADPLILLVDTRQLRVRAFVEELDIGRVFLGASVKVGNSATADSACTGKVTELAPRMSRKQAWSDHPDERFDLKTREVMIELQSADGLLPGLSVDVEIQRPVQRINDESNSVHSTAP